MINFKTAAIAATASGTILLSGLTFTGTLNLTDIKNMGWGWAEKVGVAVEETQKIADRFNLFKSDATNMINEKIAKINELNAKISELNTKVGTGESNLDASNQEIARLNEQIEQANQEIETLKNEYGIKDEEVAAAFAAMVTAESLDTNLILDEQAPDTIIPGDTEQQQGPEQQEQQVDTAATKATIENAINDKYPALYGVIATVTNTTIKLEHANITVLEGEQFRQDIMQATGLTLGAEITTGANSYTFTY